MKKNKSQNNNENIIETQIFSMLENVLKDDSDDSINSDKKDPILKIKNHQNKNVNKLTLNIPKNEKRFQHEDNFHNFNKMQSLNIPNNLGTNHIFTQKISNQPQIFINNIPVSREIDNCENRETFFISNNNTSPQNIMKPMIQFNNLSPIGKQLKKQSPRHINEESSFRNFKPPITNRLAVPNIGINMGFNNQTKQNSPKNNAKAHQFLRNNTINHCTPKICLNQIENNFSSCTTNRYFLFFYFINLFNI